MRPYSTAMQDAQNGYDFHPPTLRAKTR